MLSLGQRFDRHATEGWATSLLTQARFFASSRGAQTRIPGCLAIEATCAPDLAGGGYLRQGVLTDCDGATIERLTVPIGVESQPSPSEMIALEAAPKRS